MSETPAQESRSSQIKVRVVIGIIFNTDQTVLVAQRQAHQEKPGVWEFPGGKVEMGEDGFTALQRELREELAIDVTQAQLWLETEYSYSKKTILLQTWLVRQFSNTPRGAEGQFIEWIPVTDLLTREFPEGNKLVIDKIIAEYLPHMNYI